MLEFEPGRQISNQDIQKALAELRQHPKCSNAPVLVLNQRNKMKANRDGYPQEMYHETLEPLYANSQDEQNLLEAQGFRPRYSFREYPKALYRRSPERRFAGEDNQPEPGVETIAARSIEHEAALKKGRVHVGFSPWVASLGELPERPEYDEPTDTKIARLEGMLAQMEKQQAARPAKG